MSSRSVLNEKQTEAHAWLVLSLMFVIGVVNYLDRMMLAAVLPLVKAEFSLSDTQLGVLTGFAFALTYALFGVPLGRLADSCSRRGIITIATVTWSLLTAGCGLASSYVQLLLLRMGVAFGEAGFLPAAYSMLSDLFKPAQRYMALGVLIPSTSVGITAGLALGGLIGESHGWRAAFIVLGLPGLLIAALVLLLVREPRRGALDFEGTKAPVMPPTTVFSALAYLGKNRLYFWVVLGAGVNAHFSIGMAQWLPSFFMRSHHMSMTLIGLLFGTVFGLGLGLGQFLGGALAARRARRHIFAPLKICSVANALILPCYLGVLWSSDTRVAISMALMAPFLCGLCHAPYSGAVQNIVAADLRGTAHSIYAFVITAVGGGVSPLLVGILSDALHSAGHEEALRWSLTVSQALVLIPVLAAHKALNAARAI